MHGGGRRVGRRDGGERWEETAIQTSRFERARQRGVAGHLGETWRRGREAVEWREQRAHHTRLALSTERKGQSPTRVALAIRNLTDPSAGSQDPSRCPWTRITGKQNMEPQDDPSHLPMAILTRGRKTALD